MSWSFHPEAKSTCVDSQLRGWMLNCFESVLLSWQNEAYCAEEDSDSCRSVHFSPLKPLTASQSACLLHNSPAEVSLRQSLLPQELKKRTCSCPDSCGVLKTPILAHNEPWWWWWIFRFLNASFSRIPHHRHLTASPWVWNRSLVGVIHYLESGIVTCSLMRS